MKTLGIIAEYNPFHNGHKYHLDESMRKTGCTYSVCVMSGNFLQRGEPAILDKWLRAEIAVRNGIDLVLELPFAYACNNAAYFAHGAVRILNGLGCVTDLSFGSETAAIGLLEEAAAAIQDEDDDFSAALKLEMKKGVSYPKARHLAYVSKSGGEAAAVLENPNSILAVEYLRQCIVTKSRMRPTLIRRTGTGYADRNIAGRFASATAIRHMLIDEKKPFESIGAVVPDETLAALTSGGPAKCAGIEDLWMLLQYRLMTIREDELADIFSVTEGLENRIKGSFRQASSVRGLIRAVKTKRYTETRIQRIMMHALAGLTREKMQRFLETDRPLYARVLAMSSSGASLLKKIKKTSCASIPILTNINREAPAYPEIQELLAFDILAADLYNLATGADLYKRSDYIVKPYHPGTIHVPSSKKD